METSIIPICAFVIRSFCRRLSAHLYKQPGCSVNGRRQAVVASCWTYSRQEASPQRRRSLSEVELVIWAAGGVQLSSGGTVKIVIPIDVDET